MIDQIVTYRVQGMICPSCEDIIDRKLLYTRGVINASAKYRRSEVTIQFDQEQVSEEQLKQALEETGYPVGLSGPRGWMVDVFCALLSALLFWLFWKLKLSATPTLEAGASYLAMFLVGVLTSGHCIVMCGGILLSQTTNDSLTNRWQALSASLWYNLGRVLACTLLGCLFGAAGFMIAYSMKAKSILFTLSGALVFLSALQMWGIFPGLRNLTLVKKQKAVVFSAPFVVGFLTAFMPCTASSTMWLFALSSGSALRGALSLLCWSLGTVPLMLVLGSFNSFLPRNVAKWMGKINVAVMAALGMRMLVKGLSMVF